MATDYRKLFQEELNRVQKNQDPAVAELEQQIMNQQQGANITPTLGLVDHFTGSNFASMAPKQESKKEQLAQLLSLRGQQQKQRLDGLGKLAGMQDGAEQRAAERAFKEKMMGMQGALAKAKLAKSGAPKLGAEDKKALGYLQSLQRDLQSYREQVKDGGIRPEMWTKTFGDTPTTALRKALVENYGRLQSGGAISGDEEARFGALFGSMMDSDDVLKKKLDRIEQEIAEKNALYGGGPYATPASRVPSGGSASTKSIDLTQMNLDEMSDEEIMALSGMM